MARPGWEFEDGNISNDKARGLGQIAGSRQGSQGLYEQSSTAKHPLGYRIAFDDGRVYRYAHFAAAVTPAGKLCCLDDTSQVIADGAATAVVDSGGTAKDYASSDKPTTIYVKDSDKFTTAHSDDALAGGYLHVCDNPHQAAGEGQTYRIRSNAYTVATSVMQLDLYDAMAVNLGSEAQVAVTGCMYRNLVPSGTASGTDSVVAGLPTIAITAGYYAWLQTWGPCSALCDASAGTVAAGTIATLSDGVAGAVQPLSGGFLKAETSEGIITQDLDFTQVIVDPIVGFFISAGTNGNYVPLFLQISP